MLDHQAARRLRQGAHAACALALACAATASAQSPDTTTRGGDAAHRNWWAGTGLRPPLDLAWRVPADPSLAPLVVGGKVIVQAGGAAAAVDAATGATVWGRAVGNGDAAADASRVFVASPSGLTALDLGTGAVLWSTSEPATAPVVAGDRVVVGTGSGDLVAYSTASGTERWRVPTRIAGARPASGSGRVFAVGTCRAVALDAASGAVAWSAGDCGYDTGVPTLLAGAYVWGEGAALFSASDGTRLAGGPSPATAGSGLLFGPPPGPLVAADAGTFAPRWTFTPPLPGELRLRPAIVDGSVFATVDAADGAYLAAVDPASGREQWSGFLPGATGASAMAAGPGILVVPITGGFAALRNAPAGPLGVEATLPRNVVAAGSRTTISGALRSAGHGLPGPRAVALQADAFPFEGDYGTAGFGVAGRSGFTFRVRVARNTRYRLAADGVFYAPTEVYAQPSLRVSYVRTARPRVVRATLRIAAARGLRRAGGRVGVYRLERGGRTAQRLGAGRSASNGIARFTVRIPAGLKRSDRVFPCLRGASRQGFGVANAVDRRCGDARIPLPTATASRTHPKLELFDFGVGSLLRAARR